ncbi:hypothetical protein PFISCL1PPCAC_28940, partial [Pristionchus fissidentatus]
PLLSPFFLLLFPLSMPSPAPSSGGHRSDQESSTTLIGDSHKTPSSGQQKSLPRSSPRVHLNADAEHEAKTAQFKAGVERLLPSVDEEKKGRVGFSSQFQYIMAVIGMSVGLGNIWRFPAVAFQNGGGAFLVPYLIMGILFGLPMLYIDSSVGQFMQNSPSIVFKQYFPAAQGLGWTMATIVISIGFFYNVPCCWSL